MEVNKHAIYEPSLIGTMVYLAPECLRPKKGWELKAIDIWAIGIIAYILVCGQVPFYGNETKETLLLIAKQPLQWPPNLTNKISQRCKAFVGKLLTKKSRHRLNATQALKENWIVDKENNPNQIKKNAVENDQVLSRIGDFRHAGMYYFVWICLFVCLSMHEQSLTLFLLVS